MVVVMEHSAVVNGDSLEVSLNGKFTFADNKTFNVFLDDITRGKHKRVVINLAGVDFIDSAALGILLLTRDRCDKASASLVVRNPRGQVKQMFDISRFSELFRIEHDNN